MAPPLERPRDVQNGEHRRAIACAEHGAECVYKVKQTLINPGRLAGPPRPRRLAPPGGSLTGPVMHAVPHVPFDIEVHYITPGHGCQPRECEIHDSRMNA